MLLEWIRDHKKLSAIIAIGGFILIGFIIFIIGVLQAAGPKEEEAVVPTITVSNLNVLYKNFSDDTIGYVLNAMYAAISADQSMKNGNAANSTDPIPDGTTNQSLYPDIDNGGRYTLSIKDNAISTTEDAWGTWEVFTVDVNDGRVFKVSVGVTPNQQNISKSYTQISVIKQ